MTVGLEPTSVRSIVVQTPWSGVCTRFALTNSRRFLLLRTAHRADASLVCPIDVNDVLYRLSHATLYVNRFLSYRVRAHIHGRSSHRKGDLFGFHGFDGNHSSYWLAIWSYRLSHATMFVRNRSYDNMVGQFGQAKLSRVPETSVISLPASFVFYPASLTVSPDPDGQPSGKHWNTAGCGWA